MVLERVYTSVINHFYSWWAASGSDNRSEGPWFKKKRQITSDPWNSAKTCQDIENVWFPLMHVLCPIQKLWEDSLQSCLSHELQCLIWSVVSLFFILERWNKVLCFQSVCTVTHSNTPLVCLLDHALLDGADLDLFRMVWTCPHSLKIKNVWCLKKTTFVSILDGFI